MSQNLPAIIPKSSSLTGVSPLDLYLREIAKYPLLEPEEEFNLAVAHTQEGDVNAAHRLITSNLRLVVKIANDFRQAQINLLDLIQEGNYGLMQAVKRFNPYKGVKLSSYASWWIRAYILKFIMENKSQVKIGTTVAQRRLFFRLKKEAEKLLQEYDRLDTKLLAERLDVREKDVIEMQQRLAAPDLSLDAPPDGDNSSQPYSTVIAAEVMPADDELATEEIKKIFRKDLKEFRKTLKGRELELFDARMMAEDSMTLQEFGDKFGVTRERARQIESQIIKKLQKFVKDKGTLDI